MGAARGTLAAREEAGRIIALETPEACAVESWWRRRDTRPRTWPARRVVRDAGRKRPARLPVRRDRLVRRRARLDEGELIEEVRGFAAAELTEMIARGEIRDARRSRPAARPRPRPGGVRLYPEKPTPKGDIMLGVVAKLTIKPGTEKEFEAVAKELVAKVQAGEPGCKLYVLHKSETPNVYVFMERYVDQAASRPPRTDYFKALGRKMASTWKAARGHAPHRGLARVDDLCGSPPWRCE
jgi:quinol monooxygenase YgiN